MLTQLLESIERSYFTEKLLAFVVTLLMCVLLASTCAAPQRIQSIDNPTPERGSRATLYAHNVMPVALDIFVARAGFADVYLGSLRAYQRDTFLIVVPQGVAFSYRAANPDDWRYRAETYLIFIRREPVVVEWVIRTPIGLRVNRGAK